MSRSYAPTELKRRLKPALEELEQLGFLEPLDPEERYSWVAPGLLADHPDPEPVGREGRRPSSAPTEKSALVDALTSRAG